MRNGHKIEIEIQRENITFNFTALRPSEILNVTYISYIFPLYNAAL
jgi:hypothetical protein